MITRTRILAAVAATTALLVAGLGVPAPARPVDAVPDAECGPGSDPETAEQGRVPLSDYESGRVDRPYRCNTEVISHVDGTGGFKVHRYVDAAGHECAYYDTNLVLGNELATQIQTQGTGVAVLDMTDPTSPVQTDLLQTPAMLSPHESLEIHHERGLLVAAMGTAATLPGFVDVYDLDADCRHPELKSSTPIGLLGHESAMAPDGNTFYVSATAASVIAAIDISDPAAPVPLTYANLNSHGMNVSDDGTRLYLTPVDVGAEVLPSTDGSLDSGLVIADVSSVQSRDTAPSIDVVTEFAYPDATIAQTAIPVTIDGAPYLITIDEFVDFSDFGDPLPAAPGIGRIVDIGDESDPSIVSTLELAVHQPDVRKGLGDDPAADVGWQSYAGHYCAVPQRDDPGIVACSFILSGLRIFDIRDPAAPREIAYFNAGPGHPSAFNPEGAPYAMSAPAFVPERNEIWYSDVASGFWALRVTNDAWNPAGIDTQATTTTTTTTSPPPTVSDTGPALPATGTDWPLLPAAAAFGIGALVIGWRRGARRRET